MLDIKKRADILSENIVKVPYFKDCIHLTLYEIDEIEGGRQRRLGCVNAVSNGLNTVALLVREETLPVPSDM